MDTAKIAIGLVILFVIISLGALFMGSPSPAPISGNPGQTGQTGGTSTGPVNKVSAEMLKPPAGVTVGSSITIDGTPICLKHYNEGGMQTMECAFGIVNAADGRTYQLAMDTDLAVELLMGTKTRITGTLTALNTEKRYQSAGTITVKSMKVLDRGTAPEESE